jgi:hypothetical protein
VRITSPTDGSTLGRGSSFTATVSASDNVAVRSVTMTFNGASCVTNAAPYRCTFTMPWQRNTRATLSATATDTSGNTARATATLRSR